MLLGAMLMDESIIRSSNKFNKSTLDALDETSHSLEQNVGKDLTKLNSDVNLMQETHVTSINMFLLTFPAFCLGLVNSFALFLASCGPRSYHFSDFSCTAHRQPNEVVSESADIPLENFPTYEDCSRPRCPSTWATAVFLVERAHFITTRYLLFAGNRCVVAMLVLSARHR